MVGLLSKTLLFCLLFLTSCCRYKVKVQSYSVVKTWQKKNISIHDYISPKFLALLSNNDTVPCTTNTRVGDVIVYKYITK
jgi:hypothetical protein